MFWSPQLLQFLAIATLIITTESHETRKAHRLVGGHIKIHSDNLQDSELLTASASGSKDKKERKSDDEDRKTLSQQVADGKYGLIQKELFIKPSKRPGVLSYENNLEVPKDNINNLGGLTKNDIWLAENHLLVLKGGTYAPYDDKDNLGPLWPAIDDYKAPTRQVKIPAHPKVPPPFPVQLTENGPLQILGTNTTTTLNGTFNAPPYALPPPSQGGYEPGTGPYFPSSPFSNNYPSNTTTGQAAFPISPYPPGEYQPGSPFPQPPFPLNGSLPPFFASLPPGAAILPPPGDQLDEDDPSIYYPPPYSFYYPKDNSSSVPAGPLVPGIILPPPPNFFAPLDENIHTTTKRVKTRVRVQQTTTTAHPHIHPTTTPVTPTSIINKNNKIPPTRYIPSEINNELKPIITTTTTTAPKVVTILPVRQKTKNRTNFPSRTQSKRPPSVTILKPVQVTTATPVVSQSPSPQIYLYNNEVSGKPFKIYGPPSGTTTQAPVKIYYSTENDIETNSIQTQSSPQNSYRIRGKSTTKRPSNQYYYYEEQHQSNHQRTTLKPVNRYQQQQQSYYNVQRPKEYYVPVKHPQQQQVVQEEEPQYYFVTTRPYYKTPQRPSSQYRFVQQQQQQQTPTKTDSFSIHIARLQNQIQQQYYTTSRAPTYSRQQSSKPVYQFSFQANNYHQPKQQQQDPQDRFRPIPRYSVQIQPAVEITPTQSSPIYYQQQQQQENYQQQTTTERITANVKYYSTSPRPDYEYADDIIQVNTGRNKEQYNQVLTTSRPISQYSFEATPNPIYQGYYTKPDEGYLDKNTKEYFTTFGRKIPSGTTPVPSQLLLSTGKQRQQYQQQKPVSLEGDTLVNYVNPRPNINPDAEFIPSKVINNNNNNNYQQQQQKGTTKYSQRPSAQYNNIQQQQNDGNIIKTVNIPTAEGQPGSFISYQLPGDDGAHFYFLTPQLAQSRDQNAGFYYSQQTNNNNNARLVRNGRDLTKS